VSLSLQAISLLTATPAWANVGIPQGYLRSHDALTDLAAAAIFVAACVSAGVLLLRRVRARNLESARKADQPNG
jgi:hypothetical protein